MGLLIPIVHAERAHDPSHAAAVFRALDRLRVTDYSTEQPRVVTTGWRATTSTQLDLLIAAALPGHEHTITFERGALDDAALDALRDLATAGAGYLDVSTPAASLRVWPGRAWMHGMREPPDNVRAILGIDGPLKMGTTTIHDVTVKRSRTAVVPFDVATPREAVAFELFRACADPQLRRGFIVGLEAGTQPYLARFLRALDAESVTAEFELELDAATALATGFPDADLVWSDSDASITLPGGEISTHLLMPVSPVDEATWHARITEALTRAATI